MASPSLCFRKDVNFHLHPFYWFADWWAQTRVTLQRTASYMRGIEALGLIPATFVAWWAQVDSNHRPRAYQARALTS